MMTRKAVTFAFFTLVFVSSYLVSGCKEDNSTQLEADIKNATATPSSDSMNCSFIVFPSDEITTTEIEMIKYMREEEKLARDVYTILSAQYTLPIFKNIAKSEQKHMDLVLCLLNHYNILDPASEEIGVFNNSELQEIYGNLIARGSVSLIDALTVGATIEDLDIHDLDIDLSQTENEAIVTVFEILKCGSGNHMRAFSKLLSKNETNYTPEFITQEEYDAILNSTNKPCGDCNGSGNGKGNGKGKGKGNRNGSGNGDCDGRGKGK
jgi:hypothetical protein